MGLIHLPHAQDCNSVARIEVFSMQQLETPDQRHGWLRAATFGGFEPSRLFKGCRAPPTKRVHLSRIVGVHNRTMNVIADLCVVHSPIVNAYNPRKMNTF